MALSCALGAAVLVTGVPAVPAATAAVPARPAGPAGRTITLITGDKVVVNGRILQVRPGPGRAKVRFRTMTRDGHRSVIPADALPLIGQGRLDRRLFDVTQALAWGYDDAHRADVPVIVQRPAGVRAAAITGLRVRDTLPILGLHAAAVLKSEAPATWRRLAASDVTHLWLDGRKEASLDRSVPQIGAPAAWKKGLTGKGVTVAVLDSGYDAGHSDLKGVVVKSRGFTDKGPGDIKDEAGHGTHVASIVAGSGAASRGKYKGVAPGAKLAIAKVLDRSGYGLDSWTLAGMEWAATEAKAKVINLSLGSRDFPGLDPVEEAVGTLTRRTGALFTIAAGNAGARGTVQSPGSADAALTVGAVDGKDKLAPFSSRGPRVADGAVKPDVTAPGVGVVAARAAGSELGPAVGTSYMRLQGTSMASPHVAGAAAILAQQHPDWTAERLKATLIGSARPSPGVPAFDQGAGRIDVARAVTGPVTVDVANVSTVLRWPYTEPVRRTLTYGNDGAKPVELRLALTADQPPGRAAFELSRTTLTVPAHGTAAAGLSVSGKGVPAGTYSGSVAATATGVSVRTVVGAYVEPKSYDLVVKVLDTRGRPDRDGLLSAIAQDLSYGQDVLVSKGVTRLRVPEGSYNLVTVVDEDRECAPVILVNHPVTVRGPVTVTLDGRRAKQVRTTLDDPTAAADLALDAALIYSHGGRSYGERLEGEGCAPDSAFVLPVKQRGLSFFSRTTWRKRGSSEDRPSPYQYELADYRAGELPATPYSARKARLATVKSTFKAQGAAQCVYPSMGAEAADFEYGLKGYARRAPGTLTYHLTVDDRLRWHRQVVYGADLNGTLFARGWRFARGPHHETWNTAVIGPTAEPIDGEPQGFRKKNRLVVYPAGYADGAPGHGGVDSAATGTIKLARNGRLVKTATFDDGGLEATVPAGAATYTATSTGTRKARLSTKVEMRWTFRSSAARQGALPLRTVGYAPRGLDGLNRARPRTTTTIRVWAAAAPVKAKSLRIWASGDGARTWRALRVTRSHQAWTIKVANPAKGYVALRADLTDTAGNSVRQTIMRAYVIGG